ncbi:phage portal protein [Streptomyces griseorubiginosus]|uniref:phage portal protein n=1 Tax=Streptomyces griseorubiginosus TaxID=67304 RepID=UPI002E7FD0AC|nr:phage portal protein [Streptomyces griseorubiginosus]WUB44567.1 phage portal protein [Streptomyces griseorubiginosus]WUB53084.1 phage portal protein [Streptomyces griseorubiginosus]
MTDLTLAVNEILDRRNEYQTAEEYYEGTAEEVYTTAAIKRALRKTVNRFRLNFAATPVDTVNNRLEIASVSAVSDEAGSYLDRVWASNELTLEVGEIHKNALIYGDAYLIVWPMDDVLQVYYNSPLTTVVLYDEENPRLKRVGAKVWEITNSDGKTRTRVNLYYADRLEKYISLGERLPHTPKDSDFVPFVDETTDANGVMKHGLGEMPVFHFRTERPKGKPEHLNAYGAQDMINKLVVMQMASADFHGFPQRIALAREGSSESADFGNSAETAEISNQPGTTAILKGIDDVKEFKAADPATFLEPFKAYIRSMASTTATPLHYFEPTGNIPSGEALRTAEAPLVKKVRTRQNSFGATWREVFSFILRDGGFKEDVQVHWKPVETFDTKEAMEIARLKVQIGIPPEQVASEIGYDTALIESWNMTTNLAIQPGNQIPGENDSHDLQPDTAGVPDNPYEKAA